MSEKKFPFNLKFNFASFSIVLILTAITMISGLYAWIVLGLSVTTNNFQNTLNELASIAQAQERTLNDTKFVVSKLVDNSKHIDDIVANLRLTKINAMRIYETLNHTQSLLNKSSDAESRLGELQIENNKIFTPIATKNYHLLHDILANVSYVLGNLTKRPP